MRISDGFVEKRVNTGVLAENLLGIGRTSSLER